MSANRFHSRPIIAACAVAAVIGGVSLLPAVRAQEGDTNTGAVRANESAIHSGITARGSGQAKLQPDRAVLTFTVAVGGADPAGAGVLRADEMASRVAAALKKAGIAEKEIAITLPSGSWGGPGGFGGGLGGSGFGGGGFITAGGRSPLHEAAGRTRLITVTVRQMGNIASIARQAVEAGAESNVLIQMAGGDEAAARNAAFKQAVQQATEKAKAMASAAGYEEIRLDAIKEESAFFTGYHALQVDARTGESPDLTTAIPVYSATVTVRYSLPPRDGAGKAK